MNGQNTEMYRQVLKDASDVEYNLNFLRDDSYDAPQLNEALSEAHRMASELVTELERVRTLQFPNLIVN